MPEGLKLDDLFTTCPRCNGSALEPVPGQPPAIGGLDPNVLKYNMGARLCADCGGRTKIPSPDGEALLEFLLNPVVTSRIEQACSAHRSQVNWQR